VVSNYKESKKNRPNHSSIVYNTDRPRIVSIVESRAKSPVRDELKSQPQAKSKNSNRKKFIPKAAVHANLPTNQRSTIVDQHNQQLDYLESSGAFNQSKRYDSIGGGGTEARMSRNSAHRQYEYDN
jgi:hypothetical protein